MISAFQKAYPRLAALLSPRDNASPAATEEPPSKPDVKEVASPSWASGPAASEAQRAQRALNQFFEVATERVSEIRSLFAQVSAAPPGDARKAILEKLCSQVRVVGSLCDLPGLETISKVIKAFEQLLKQISDRPLSLTASTLRTTASSIVLLESLCRPGLQGDIASNPPPRFLSIDDDSLSRLAVATSLKQAFSPPDHAETGEAALALVEKQSYDIIFLDVEMPGMNGFEVCTKIHQTKLNATTPVVFVTVHSDFDSRAKASEASGADLIAKPFLPCELTLKALTMLVRRRMQPRATKS